MPSPDEASEIFKKANLPFNTEDVQHGRKFTFSDGGMIIVYSKAGKVVPQGKPSAARERACQLLQQATLVGVPGPSAPSSPELASSGGASHVYSNKVFIVYGHDSVAREQLELILRRLKLEPVVLQNLPSGGQTVIEKLESNIDVRFACVLLTPDDIGCKRADHPSGAKQRARQNVVLELGMFLAKLGRQKVAILHKGDIELPSDINGLLYISFQEKVDEIKERLAAELQEAGFKINIKDLLS